MDTKVNDLTKEMGLGNKVEEPIITPEKVEEPIVTLTPEIVTPTSEEVTPTEEPPVTKTEVIKVLDDKLDIMSLLAEINPKRTVEIPLLSQGLLLTSEVVTMTEINNATQSDNFRMALIELFFNKLTSASKKLFGGKYATFKESISFYDLDFFAEKQIASWGDDKFSGECGGDNCDNEIAFEKKISDMLKVSDELLDRIERIKKGEELSILEIKNSEAKIDDIITAKLGLPTVEKFEYLNKMKLPTIMFVKMLHIESIIVRVPGKVPMELPLIQNTSKDVLSILDSRNISELDDRIEEEFKFLNINYEVKVACEKCGHINTFRRDDLMESLVGKILS